MVRVAAAAVSAPPSELTLSPSLVVVAAPARARPASTIFGRDRS